MVTEPAATPVAWVGRPCELIVATDVLEDVQEPPCTGLVVPFSYTAVAVKDWFRPTSTLAEVGEMVMDESRGAPTVSVAEPVTVPKVAEMLAVPATSAVTSPWLPLAFDACATATSLDDQVACEVRSTVAPLL